MGRSRCPRQSGENIEETVSTDSFIEGDVEPILEFIRWPSLNAGCYTELFKNLAGAIRNGEELKVKWEEVLTVLEIIEAALQSSKEERTIRLT